MERGTLCNPTSFHRKKWDYTIICNSARGSQFNQISVVQTANEAPCLSVLGLISSHECNLLFYGGPSSLAISTVIGDSTLVVTAAPPPNSRGGEFWGQIVAMWLVWWLESCAAVKAEQHSETERLENPGRRSTDEAWTTTNCDKRHCHFKQTISSCTKRTGFTTRIKCDLKVMHLLPPDSY